MKYWMAGMIAMGVSLPLVAVAGDMDALGYAFMLGYLYLGAVIVGGLLALLACRLIRDRRVRTLARWLIAVLLYTPVVWTTPDHHTDTLAAFWLLLAGTQGPNAGWPSHPLILAYAGALMLSAPVVALWIRLRERYRDRPALASIAP